MVTLAPQGLRQAAAAADGHEGPAEELRRLPQAAQLAVVAALHQGGSGGAPAGRTPASCGARAPGWHFAPVSPGPELEPGMVLP